MNKYGKYKLESQIEPEKKRVNHVSINNNFISSVYCLKNSKGYKRKVKNSK